MMNNNFFSYNKYRFLFIIILLFLNINLIINTESNNIDFREYFKILAPTLFLYVITFLQLRTSIKIFNILYYILLIHIIISLIYQILFHNNLFQITVDNRYYLPLLGRSAGETALAFFVLNIASYFYSKFNFSNTYNKLHVPLFFLTLNVCIITQSRTWLFMLALYSLLFYMFSENKKIIIGLILSRKKEILLYACITIVVMIYSNYFGELFKRMDHSLLSGRVEIWKEYIEVHSNKSLPDIFLGENLERKTLVNIQHGIETSDSHNLFFDIAQTFGVLGLILLLGSYFFSIKNTALRLSLPIVLVFMSTGLLMSQFKVPYLLYTNIIILIIPIILCKKT